jgi:glucose-6-phosphate 1-dehydrogenase
MTTFTTIAKASPAAPCTVVIFGASGDLAKRKLIPALYNLDLSGDQLLDEHTAILGFARRPMSNQEFRAVCRDGVIKYSRLKIDNEIWQQFASRLEYLSGLDAADGFVRLRKHLEQIEKSRGLPPNRVYYLSIPPEAIKECVEGLHSAGLINDPTDPHFTRLVVEKPIGSDLKSAMEINRSLRLYFAEPQIFRIDHYLGKETVQNVMVLRFGNNIFEQMWNKRYVDHVQITVAEEEGLGTRAMYYENAGALRDMVQNHLLQLLSLISMEPPVSLEAEAINYAKLDALRAMRPMDRARVSTDVVRARYRAGDTQGEKVPGYLEEKGVAANSATETFVALKTYIDNWRWSGVPFYLRTGKRLALRASAIHVQFKDVPPILFNRGGKLAPNVLTLRIQPDEGFSFDVMAKRPGLDLAISSVRMNLHYESEFDSKSPEAYERLLLDVMAGDHTLFIGEQFIEKSWQFVQDILDAWNQEGGRGLEDYPAGAWGPEAADRLIGADGRAWRLP